MTSGDIRTGVAEAANPAIQTDPSAVVSADVVAELIVSGITGQRTTTTVVAGVTD